ncbi:MAG: sulfotransferase [Caldilineaceae bacterium]
MAAYPDAKVVLTVRNPERWYESTYETVYQLSQLMPLARLAAALCVIRRLLKLYWGGLFEGRFEERDHAIARFNSWNAEVQATGPCRQTACLLKLRKDGNRSVISWCTRARRAFPACQRSAEMLTRGTACALSNAGHPCGRHDLSTTYRYHTMEMGKIA